MNFKDVKNDKDLWDLMTEPTDGLIDCVSRLAGDCIILGGSGKMGKELTGMLMRADERAGKARKIFVASSFSNPAGTDQELLTSLGAQCLKGDLSNPEFLESLPVVPFVIYMMGFKFGTGRDWRKAFHLNSIVPYLAGEKYTGAHIVVFSSGNPYPHTPPESGGCGESTELEPQGIYGWSIVARENSFNTTALRHLRQRICHYRLMYAQHLYYGVLVDLAKMLLNGEPISLEMPAVNLISQRDANDAALRLIERCDNPPFVVNVAGPVVSVRTIVEKMSSIMKREPEFADGEAAFALIADDTLCRRAFGPYRDSPDEMIEAAAEWVLNGGAAWDKPTLFGKVRHNY